MSRTDRHKELKQKKRTTLERAFNAAVRAGIELAYWLELHQNIKEEDYRIVVSILAVIDAVVEDIANLYHYAYGYYTVPMADILEIRKEEELADVE